MPHSMAIVLEALATPQHWQCRPVAGTHFMTVRLARCHTCGEAGQFCHRSVVQYLRRSGLVRQQWGSGKCQRRGKRSKIVSEQKQEQEYDQMGRRMPRTASLEYSGWHRARRVAGRV